MNCPICGDSEQLSCFRKPTYYEKGIYWCRNCGTIRCSCSETGVFSSDYVPKLMKNNAVNARERMSRRLRVYISGPITKGDRVANFAQAASVQQQLMEVGFAPLNPMLSMMHPAAWSIPHEQWIASDLPWVEAADAVLRLPGESTGADAECEHAIKYGIPIFNSITGLRDFAETRAE